MKKPINKYSTTNELIHLYPAFSISQIRYYMRNAQKNGFAKCMRRIGKRVFINTDEFEKWVESHTEVKNEPTD